jgi:dsRNA-specific ribonuclease
MKHGVCLQQDASRHASDVTERDDRVHEAVLRDVSRLVFTMLFCAALGDALTLGPFTGMTEERANRSLYANVIGAIIGAMIEQFGWRRINIFGRKQ